MPCLFVQAVEYKKKGGGSNVLLTVILFYAKMNGEELHEAQQQYEEAKNRLLDA